MQVWTVCSKPYTKLGKSCKQYKEAAVYMNKERSPPQIDSYIILFNLQKAGIGVIRYVAHYYHYHRVYKDQKQCHKKEVNISFSQIQFVYLFV